LEYTRMDDPNTSRQALAAQNSFGQALLGRLMPWAGKPAGLLGAGMAQTATAQTLQSRPYQIHVQEAQALGQTPLTPEQFAATQQGQGQGLLRQQAGY
jgi:hypothetical protein